MCVNLNCIPPIAAQVWIVFGVQCSILAVGMNLGFTSSLLRGLQAPESDIKTDINSESWLAGIIGLASIAGTLMSSCLMHYYGRRTAFILGHIPGLIGLVLMYFASSVSELMVARALWGFTAGGICSLGMLVIGEYTNPRYRGIFLNLETISVYLGNTSAHILGGLYHWRSIVLFIIIPQSVSLLSLFTWPESPYWLASRERYSDSKNSFHWLRGEDEQANMELEAMIATQRELTSSRHPTNATVKTFKRLSKLVFLKPVFINLVCAILLESSGRHIFPAYALQIIGEITGNTFDTSKYILYIDLILMFSATSSTLFIKLMKRRTLLFSSGVSAVIIFLTLSLYLYLVSANIIMGNRTWIPISMIVAYFVLANAGCLPMSMILTGEMLPFEYKEVGSAVSGISIGLCIMFGLKATPYLLLNLKIYGTLTLLAVCTGISLFLLYLILPETKDKTLLEIEDCFSEGKSHHVERNEENSKMIT